MKLPGPLPGRKKPAGFGLGRPIPSTIIIKRGFGVRVNRRVERGRVPRRSHPGCRKDDRAHEFGRVDGSASSAPGRSPGSATCRASRRSRASGSWGSATCTASRPRGSPASSTSPRSTPSWENLVEDDEIDAVVIGAWPYLHCPVTLAAIGAGKHVLTQARMAMNAREAQRMLDAVARAPRADDDGRPQPLRPGRRRLRPLADRRRLPRHAPRGPRPRPLGRAGRPVDAARLAADDQVFGLQHADAGHPLRDRAALDAAGQPGDRLRLEAGPEAARPRDRQGRQGRHRRQRPGADEPRGGRLRQLSAQRRRLARHADGRSRCTAARGRSSTS